MKPKVGNETKEAKFRRIASARTQRILDDIRLLGNCANHATYEYTEEDARKIFKVIDDGIKALRMKFGKKSGQKFSLS